MRPCVLLVYLVGLGFFVAVVSFCLTVYRCHLGWPGTLNVFSTGLKLPKQQMMTSFL